MKKNRRLGGFGFFTREEVFKADLVEKGIRH